MTYQRRTVGIVAAIVLALLGTLGLVGYVQGAKDRRRGRREAGQGLRRERQDRRRHRRSSELADQVKSEKVPAKVQAQDAVTSLKDAQGRGHLDRRPPGRAARDEPLRRRPAARRQPHAKGVPVGHLRRHRVARPRAGARRPGARRRPRRASSASSNNTGTDADAAALIAAQRARHQRADRRQQRRQPEEEGSHRRADRQVLRDPRPDAGRPREGRHRGQRRRQSGWRPTRTRAQPDERPARRQPVGGVRRQAGRRLRR